MYDIMNSLILQVFCSIFSGLAQSAAIPSEFLKFGSPFLGLFCLVPLYVSLYHSKSYFRTGFLAALQVLTVHLSSSFWLLNFHGFGAASLGASAFGTTFEAFACGILFHAVKSFRKKDHYLREKSGLAFFAPFARIFWFTSCWIFWEWAKSTGAMGYPWGTIWMTSFNWKIITQISDITGVYGVTFIFALINALAGEWCIYFSERSTKDHSKSRFSSIVQVSKLTAAFTAAVCLYGLIQFYMPRTPEKYINTVIVQQNVDPWGGDEEEQIEVSKRLTEKAIEQFDKENLTAELVLWSEGILSTKFPNGRFRYENFPGKESLKDFIKKHQVPFVIGGATKVNTQLSHSSNSAIFFDKNGEYAGFYSKIQLVPFAEFIPYSDSEVMSFIMDDIVKYDANGWTPGFQYVIFRVPVNQDLSENAPLEYNRELYKEVFLDENGESDPEVTQDFIKNSQENPLRSVKFSVPICFEDSFPNVMGTLHNMGSEVFMNITNDSWSKTASAEYQHFVASSFAAIQYRTTLVRCCNSGYSVVVNPKGNIIADLPVFTEDSIAVRVPVYAHSSTVYAVWGNWFAYLNFAFIFALILTAFILQNFTLPELKKIKFLSIQITWKAASPSHSDEHEPAEKAAASTRKAPAKSSDKAKKTAASIRKAAAKSADKAKKATTSTKKAPAKSADKAKKTGTKAKKGSDKQ